jgi:hypothetical protein
LNPIHEGTHGIQALDLLGRKVVAAGGAGLTVLLSTIAATAQRAQGCGAEAPTLASQLSTAADRVATTTTRL